MKKKINLLIGTSIVALLVLSAVQWYLVKTTYDYKVAQLHTEIKDKIASFTNEYSDIDSLIIDKKEVLYRELAQNYIRDKSNKLDLKSTLLNNESRDELTRTLQLKIEREIPTIKINFAVVLNKFILYNSSKKTDTIFSEKAFIKNKLFGNLTTLTNSFLVRNYVGTTSGSPQMKGYKLLTEDTMYVSVANWETIILKRMRMVLCLSLLSIITLISLFIIAIKALIKQKKVSDIKTDFINNITHELKTPLATLGISTKILERENIRNNDIHFNSILSTITRQNNRLQNLIDQVMANSLDATEIELHKEKITTESFLEIIIEDFRLVYPKIIIEKQFRTSQTILMLDKFHFTTAILNVLENAVKYGSNTIIIKTNLIQAQLNISIEDNGIGISKNKHSLLFDKFYRVEQGNLHNTKGLGLGLYYVDQIIKAHQGSITVASDIGKGAKFNISFTI